MTRLCGRAFLVAFLIALVAVSSAIPAFAATPANDNFAGAQTIAFGDSVVVDTSEATVEDLDRQAGDACPSPPGPPPSTVNTIWFTFTADATTPSSAAVTISGAFWDAGVAIVTGSPGSFTGIACGPFMAFFSPVAGTTYKIMIFDFSESTTPNGGTATVTLGEVPPPPELGLTVNKTGTFNTKTGTATISGTYTCTNAFFVNIFGNVSQSVGRFTIQGFFNTVDVQCDGEAHAWSAEATSTNGKFAGGKAMTVTIGFACGISFCSQAMVEQTIQLKGGGRG
jgi:uncharacterized protein DUF6299